MTTNSYETRTTGSLLEGRSFTVEKKAEVEHQAMMQLVIDAGFAPKSWQAAWGRWIKASGISEYDLERLIRYARSLSDKFNPRGFVRNRLQNRDWHKFDLPK